MRSHTIARVTRALLIMATVMMLPQLASAQLPVTTKKLTLQDFDASAGVSLQTPTEVTTGYTLTLPAAVGGQGSFLYASDASGVLAWSNAPGGANYVPRWDNGSKQIVWTDPASADNPNWSLSGNALAGAGTLGTTTAGGSINIVTGSGGLTRMSIAANGDISIATDAANGGDVTIGNNDDIVLNSTTTKINETAGSTSINTGANAAAVAIGNATTATMDLKAVATTIAGTTLGITAATTQTGAFNLAGASSPLQVGGSAGTDKDVLVSKGAGVTPEWQSITSAVGVRAKGRVAIADNATTVTVTGLTGFAANDIVTFTIEGAAGAVFGVLTSRTAGTGFTVSLSGAFDEASASSGFLNYIVMTP